MLQNQWDAELQRQSLTGLFQRAPTPSWLSDWAKIFFDMYLQFKVSFLASWVTENSPPNKGRQQHKNTCKAEKCLMFVSKLSRADSLCLFKPTIPVWEGAAKWKRPPKPNTTSLYSQGHCHWVNIMVRCQRSKSKSSLVDNIKSQRCECGDTCTFLKRTHCCHH